MSEAGLAWLRAVLGWFAAALCLCAVAALVDGFIASARTDPDSLSLLSGGMEPLTGPVPPGGPDAPELSISSDNPGVTLTVTAQFTGYWLGGRMWRGELRVAPGTPPGQATVTLRDPTDVSPGPPRSYHIKIFANQAAMHAASPSLITHLVGWPPFGMAGAIFVVVLALGGGVYLISHRMDSLWRAQGKAVVYMTSKTSDGQLISFGLGSSHGLEPGTTVTVRDATGLEVALASVVRCTATDAAALVEGDEKVELGSCVFLGSSDTPAQGR